eukprot:scaffold56559_cov61-Phaeocystis_antarctica.AAC.1
MPPYIAYCRPRCRRGALNGRCAVAQRCEGRKLMRQHPAYDTGRLPVCGGVATRGGVATCGGHATCGGVAYLASAGAIRLPGAGAMKRPGAGAITRPGIGRCSRRRAAIYPLTLVRVPCLATISPLHQLIMGSISSLLHHPLGLVCRPVARAIVPPVRFRVRIRIRVRGWGWGRVRVRVRVRAP